VLLLALLVSPAWAQEPAAAARVAELSGSGSVTRAGDPPRTLEVDLQLFPLDRIETGADTRLHIIFTDGTSAYLGSNAALVIEAYRHAQDDPAFVARVVQGAFRFVTGLIARNRPGVFNVNAVASTIGVRGTHFAGEVEGVAVTVMLLAPAEPARTAIEVSNAFGAVVIDEPGFGTEIPDEFSPPGPVRRMQIRTIENLLRSIQSIPRVPRGPGR
jgi:hypothetical protein